MSEEALQEKEAAVAGDGFSPAVSRAQMSTRSNFSGHSGGPTSTRSLACAAHRVSVGSISPPTSKRALDVDGDYEVGLAVAISYLAFFFNFLLPAPSSLIRQQILHVLKTFGFERTPQRLAVALPSAEHLTHLCGLRQDIKGKDAAVDIVQLNSNGKVDANGGEASQSALPFDQLYMTFDHGTYNIRCLIGADSSCRSPS